MRSGMDLEFKFGQIRGSIKENGKMIAWVVRVSFGMPMVIFMMGIGNKMKSVVMVYTFTHLVPFSKDNGVKVYKMVKE